MSRTTWVSGSRVALGSLHDEVGDLQLCTTKGSRE